MTIGTSFKNVGDESPASSPTKSIETVIRSVKTMVTIEIGSSIWQRSYHNHIIRSEKDYREIWRYTDNNIIKWKYDCFYTN